MTTEPGAQPQPFEAPQTASDAEQQQTQPGATPAALRVQILSTEHWSLLATRSQTWNESFARAQMFVSALSASVIALALVAQSTGFESGFIAFALVLLPVVLFLGLTTYWRRRWACSPLARGTSRSPPTPGGRTAGGERSIPLSVPTPD